MNEETKPQDSSLGDLGVSFLALGGLVLGGIYYVSQPSLTIAPPPVIRLEWDNPAEVPGSFTTEVWSSTNLTTWTLKTNIAGTNRVTLPADKPREFFKVRSKGTNGLVSDWARK